MSEVEHYDVVVVGGGSAGVGAAVGAARSGARTLLVEQHGCLGGASTMRNVLTYCGLYTLGARPQLAVGGVAAEVVAKLRRWNAATGPIRHRGVFIAIDPEAVKRALDEICAEAKVEILLHATVTRAARNRDRVTAITYEDRNEPHDVTAAAFVDASGDGDLAFRAGASTRYGNHGFVNLGTLGTRFGGIPADVPVTAEMTTAAIHAAQARGVIGFSKDRSVVARLPFSGDVVTYLASADYDARDARSITAAEIEGRRQAWLYLDAIRSLPGCENCYLVSSGPEFGTRESRHINSRRQLTWDEVERGIRQDDAIALGAWGVEWHDRDTFRSTFVLPPQGGAYDIPLGCLISADTPNLFAAGRTADGDQRAGASLRVMGTAFATGQAAGVAAAQFAADGGTDAAAVRHVLRAQGAILDQAQMPAPVDAV
jgi:FAD dependent oxidoreductase